MRPARPPRIPHWSAFSALLLLLLPLFAAASRPRPHVLKKRNPTYSPLSSLSTLSTLSDLDANLDFNDKNSLLSKVLIPRPVGSRNLTNLQRLFEQKFKHLGWHVERDSFETSTPIGQQKFTNLVFTHDPGASRRLVLSAHLDSKYFPPSSPQSQFVGATDSAVPCALLYDLAQSLTLWLDERRERVRAQGGEEGRRDGGQGETLTIVLFDGEEAFEEWSSVDSIYGAKHLVDKWSNDKLPSHDDDGLSKNTPSPTQVRFKNELERISHLVLLDLLGAKNPLVRSFYSNTGWFFDEFLHAEERLGREGFLWQGLKGEGYERAAEKLGAKEKSFFIDRKAPQGWMGTIEDDHLPFLAKGVPVVHLISVPFPRVWHTLADDANALDLDTIKAWALIVRLTVAEYLGLDPELNRLASASSKRDELILEDPTEGTCTDSALAQTREEHLSQQ